MASWPSKMPGVGKTIETVDQLGAGLPVMIRLNNRTRWERAVVESRATSNIGEPYLTGDGKCEHDVTMAQYSVPLSPTVNALKVVSGLGLAFVLLKALTDEN